MSISRSQAELLSSGFLDTLPGESKSVLQPRETFTELFLIAGEMVEESQDNLNHSNSNASGKLSASMILSNPQENGNVVSVDMLMLEYGRYVNSGVKGTRSGQSTAGYSFRTENPSSKMLKSLLSGVKRAKKSTTNVNRNKTTSKNEIKNARISDLTRVWGAAVNIKRYGIKPTGFLDKAIVSTEKKMEDRLGAAFKVDIINSI